MRQAFKVGLSAMVRDVPARRPGLGQVRLAVKACGICGTDLHPPAPADMKKEIPFGHEMAGVVLEVGDGTRGLSPGDAVVVESSTACGFCDACRDARQELCQRMTGPWEGGFQGMAEEIIVPAVSCIPYDGLTPEIACLQEPLGVAVDTVRLAELSPRSRVLVMGPGPIGLMAAALARRMGVRRLFMSAYRRYALRCDVARRFGVDGIVHPEETPIEDFDYGGPIDRILVTTPPATIAAAAKLSAKGGIIVFIGLGAGGESGRISLDGDDFHFKKLQLRASFASPALYGPTALDHLRDGVVDGQAILTHTFPLEQAAEAMSIARDKTRSIKVVVTP